MSARPLEKLVLKSHVVLRFKTDTGAEDVGEARALLGESVNDGSACGSKRSLFIVSKYWPE